MGMTNIPNIVQPDASGNVVLTGSLTLPAGTAAAPSLILNGATDGLFQAAAGVVGVAGAGVETARLSATLFQVPAASLLTWNGRGTINSSSDGIFALNKNAGGSNGVAMVFGNQVSLGNTTTATRLRTMNANQSANAAHEGSSYIITNVGAGAGLTDASGNGFSVVSATLNSALALLQLGVEATKTSAYSVVAGDSGTTFNNTAAGGQVVYTLPAAAVGLKYSFVNTAAGATFSKVLAVAADKIAQAGTLGAAAGNLISSAIWSTVTIECYVANVWVVTGSTGGAWTLT